jgi:hypothetical protein
LLLLTSLIIEIYIREVLSKSANPIIEYEKLLNANYKVECSLTNSPCQTSCKLVNSIDEFKNCKYKKIEPSYITFPNLMYYLRVSNFRENEIRNWFTSLLYSIVLDIFGDKESAEYEITKEELLNYHNRLKEQFDELYLFEQYFSSLSKVVDKVYSKYNRKEILSKTKDEISSSQQQSQIYSSSIEDIPILEQYLNYIHENYIKPNYENQKEVYEKSNSKIAFKILERLEEFIELYEKIQNIHSNTNPQKLNLIVLYLNKLSFDEHYSNFRKLIIENYNSKENLHLFTSILLYIFKYRDKENDIDFPNIDLNEIEKNISIFLNNFRSKLISYKIDDTQTKLKYLENKFKDQIKLIRLLRKSNLNDNDILFLYKLNLKNTSNVIELPLTVDYFKYILSDDIYFLKFKECFEDKFSDIENVDNIEELFNEISNDKCIIIFTNNLINLKTFFVKFLSEISYYYFTNLIILKNEFIEKYNLRELFIDRFYFDILIERFLKDYTNNDIAKTIYSFSLSYFHDYKEFEEQFKVYTFNKDNLLKKDFEKFLFSEYVIIEEFFNKYLNINEKILKTKEKFLHNIYKEYLKVKEKNKEKLEDFILTKYLRFLFSDIEVSFINNLDFSNTSIFLKYLDKFVEFLKVKYNIEFFKDLKSDILLP